MGAAAALGGDESSSVSFHDLRPLIGAEVAADTMGGPVVGTLLSCTKQSAWIVGDDVDHLVALPHLLAVHRR